jgi:hypothetical protein
MGNTDGNGAGGVVMSDNVTPIRPGLMVLEQTPFDKLQDEMMEHLNALHCACTALTQCDAIDRGETSTDRALAVAWSCSDNLHRLLLRAFYSRLRMDGEAIMDGIEAWELRTRREGTALAVGS